MNQNQCPFEVVRDIATVLLSLKDGETREIRLNKHGQYIDWTVIEGQTPCGPSEAACLIEDAYNVVYGGQNKKPFVDKLMDRLRKFGFIPLPQQPLPSAGDRMSLLKIAEQNLKKADDELKLALDRFDSHGIVEDSPSNRRRLAQWIIMQFSPNRK